MTEKIHSFIKLSPFCRGFVRVIDITGSISREAIRRQINSRSAAESIRQDWYNVGNDLKKAISEYSNEESATSK